MGVSEHGDESHKITSIRNIDDDSPVEYIYTHHVYIYIYITYIHISMIYIYIYTSYIYIKAQRVSFLTRSKPRFV